MSSLITELMDLSGRRALITGATGALGQVIADTLAQLGADLVLVDRPNSDFELIEQRIISQWSVDIQSIACDLENEEERNVMIDTVKSSGSELNILVNNAAFVGTSDLQGWAVPFEEQSLVAWRRAMEVNLTAAFHLCQSFTSTLRDSQGGSIINIASIYGECAPDWKLYKDTSLGNPAAYAASKAGLIQLTRWLATTIAPKVRVNTISPGGIFREQPKIFIERYVEKTPLGRMASEDDLRGAITFLASDLSQYVTGQIMRIDGGWGV